MKMKNLKKMEIQKMYWENKKLIKLYSIKNRITVSKNNQDWLGPKPHMSKVIIKVSVT